MHYVTVALMALGLLVLMSYQNPTPELFVNEWNEWGKGRVGADPRSPQVI